MTLRDFCSYNTYLSLAMILFGIALQIRFFRNKSTDKPSKKSYGIILILSSLAPSLFSFIFVLIDAQEYIYVWKKIDLINGLCMLTALSLGIVSFKEGITDRKTIKWAAIFSALYALIIFLTLFIGTKVEEEREQAKRERAHKCADAICEERGGCTFEEWFYTSVFDCSGCYQGERDQYIKNATNPNKQ